MANTKKNTEVIEDSLNENVKTEEAKVVKKAAPKTTKKATTTKTTASKTTKETAEKKPAAKKTTTASKAKSTTEKKTTATKSTAAKSTTKSAAKSTATKTAAKKTTTTKTTKKAAEVKPVAEAVEEVKVVEAEVKEPVIAEPVIETPVVDALKEVEAPKAPEAEVEAEKEHKTFRHLPEHGPIDEKTGKEILLSLKNVDITFGRKDRSVKAVKNATFDIYKGETFSLVGESGSGKTTIGRAVIRVNPLAAGEILYKGVRISGKIPRSLDREVIRNIQMVFQDPAASLNERATVEYIVSEGLYNFHLYKNKQDRIQKVEKIIEEVGLLPEHLTRYPHEFSGGQRQRVGLARAIVMEPELIVADEPISALDVSIRAQILNLLKKFQEEKDITYLFIAHDLSIVRFISDRIGVIYKGDIVEIAEAEELFNYPLHPYTRSLISAIPIPDPQLEKNKVLFTYDPSIHDYSVNKPSLVDIGHNHLIFGNEEEIAKYKQLREDEVDIKSVTILSPEDKAKYEEEHHSEDEKPEITIDEAAILERPIHDTGNNWLGVLSIALPLIGLIMAFFFKRHNYIRNYKMCKKWAIIGLIVLAAIIVLYFTFLLIALI